MRNRWLALAEEPGSLSPPIALTPKARGAESGRNKEVREAWRQVVFHQLRTPAKYALNPKLMALPTAEHLQENFSMAPDGYGLPTLLSDLAGAHPEQFIEIGNRFCGFFPQYTSVRLRPEKALLRALSGGIHREASRVGKGITFQTRSGQTVRAQQASDGAILFLGFLTLAHLPDPPNVLLIEEPENGIYPKRLGEVIKLLKELMNRTEGVRFPQIIMTTQSPYVLSHFRPEEVTFLSRPPEEPDGPVRARPLRDAPNINERLADGFYLGEVWYNISEEELFGEP